MQWPDSGARVSPLSSGCLSGCSSTGNKEDAFMVCSLTEAVNYSARRYVRQCSTL